MTNPIPARRVKLILYLVALLGGAFQIYCALRPLSAIDGITIPDDGYICLTIARNIALGRGALFGDIATNGFQPLWVFFIAPLFALFRMQPDGYVHAALVIGILFNVATFILLARLFDHQKYFLYLVVMLAFFWFPNAAVLSNVMNGMETSLAAFLLIAILKLLQRYDYKPTAAMPWRSVLLLGVLLGLGVLARIDVGLLAVCLGLYWLFSWSKQSLARLMVITVVALAIYLPWLIYSWTTTGDWFPVSGTAVRILSIGADRAPDLGTYKFMLMRAWEEWNGVYGSGFHLIIIILAIGATAFTPIKEWLSELFGRRSYRIYLSFCLTLLAAYVGYIFTPWFFVRYFYPLQIGLALCLATLLAQWLLHTRTAIARIVLTVSLSVVFLVANINHEKVKELLFSKDSYDRGYRNLGLWAAANFPEGTILGAQQAGAIAYYAPKLHVVNLDGVVSRPALDAMRQKDMIGYAIRQRVEFMVGWEMNTQFMLDNSRPEDQEKITLDSQIADFRTWGYDWQVHRFNLEP